MSSIKEKFEILKNYEREHGKIPMFDQYMIFTQKGTLIKRPSQRLRPLVQLVTNLGVTTQNAFHDLLREISKYEEDQKKEQEKEQISNVIDQQQPIEQTQQENQQEEIPEIILTEHNEQKEQETRETITNSQNGFTVYLGRTHEIRYNEIKQAIIEYLDRIENLDGWFFKYHVKSFDKTKWTTLPINSENMPIIKDFLNRRSIYTNINDDLETFFNEIGVDVRNDMANSNNYQLTSNSMNIGLCDRISITPKAFGRQEGETRIYCDNGGAFYDKKLKSQYAHLDRFTKRYQIFSQTTDNTGKIREEYNSNCLVYAFEQSGLLDETTIKAIKIRCFTRLISRKQLEDLCNEFKLRVTLTKWSKRKHQQWESVIRKKGQNYLGYTGNDFIATIPLALINKHYFLDEDIEGLSEYYLRNIDEIDTAQLKNPNTRFTIRAKNIKKGKTYYDTKKDIKVSSRTLVQVLEEKNLVEPLTFSERSLMSCDLYNYVSKTITNLDINEHDCKLIDYKEKNMKCSEIYYADCESDVVSFNEHRAFCICYTKRGSNNIQCKIGPDCLEEWLDEMPNHSTVYFHNLGYDARLMTKFTIIDSLDKNGRIMQQTIKYKGKMIKLKDSYSILSIKLSRFPQTFNLQCGQKEMFPYRYYTFDRLENNVGIISEAGQDELQWDTKTLDNMLCIKGDNITEEQLDKLKWDQEQFIKNIDSIPGCRLGEDEFDMKKYVEFYCKQDVRLLQQGFDKFREDTLNGPLEIDVDDFLTSPSLANDYLTKHVYMQADEFYQYSGITREYIQQFVRGGRCMTRDNEKWEVNKVLNDFDAVSLYPSAMKRLYVVNGKPRVFDKDQLNVQYLLNNTCGENEQVSENKPISAYLVHIQITKIGISRHFPLIVKIDEKTHTNQNVNECCEMYVDNIGLEDLIKYQQIECEVLDGIYWTGTKDFTFRDVIQQLHELRCEYKKTKNPMQEAVKLIMNSGYGKMIQKPIKTSTVYKQIYTTKTYYRQFKKNGQETPKSIERFEKHKDEIQVDKDGKQFIKLFKTPADSFMKKNHAKVKEAIDIATNLCAITLNQQIDKHFTSTLTGVQVLSMSKRIMNEVMCTAEDNDIGIYYQDTDSMHIENDKIQLLAEKFKERFGRELIGKELGQFHNDFDELTNNPISIKSYFLGKKAYIDKLTNDNGEIAYHIRMKGVTNTCITLQAIKQFNSDPMELYKHLSEGKKINFNLTDVKAKFKNNKNRTISNITDFKRNIKFPGPLNIVN